VSSGKERLWDTGMVLVTMTSWNTPELRRSIAGGENTACVAHAYTSLAPSACSTFAAFVMVPAPRTLAAAPFLPAPHRHTAGEMADSNAASEMMPL
jgi:hypothetical protein